MGRFSRKALVLGALAVMSGGIGALVACSSSSSGTPGGGLGTEGGTSSQACTQNTALQLVFSPMYSAYVTDSTQQVFQIPVVANGVPAGATVTWSASDPSAVTITDDSADTPGAQMITLNKLPQGGTVTITANAGGGSCGSSTLNVTSATEAQWAAGNARYNSSVPLDLRCINGGTHTRDGGPCPDAGPGCTACHGATANSGFGFNDVAHTPEQTGGFSDQDLIDIVVNGVVPDGGYFDPGIVSYQGWQGFHHWSDIQGSDQQGMVVYLRSLTPSNQSGTSNFGGHYDGGHHEGGHHHDGGFDGGVGPAPDGATDDGATTGDGATTD